MKHCGQCGYPVVSIGSYCINCGNEFPTRVTELPELGPEDFPTQMTAQLQFLSEDGGNDRVGAPTNGSAAAVNGSAPGGKWEPEPAPYAARFPLYADETSAAEPPVAALIETAPPVPQHYRQDEQPEHRQRAASGIALAMIIGGVALVLLFAVSLGGFFLLRGGSESASEAAPASAEATPPVVPSTTPDPSSGAPTPSGVTAPANPTDVAGKARAQVPDTAPSSRDLQGQTSTFVAGNLTDGSPTTAWRMAGSGAGRSLTFTFPSPVVLTEVGLINGYAKVGQSGSATVRWYDLNRRVTQATWGFGDGSRVSQSFTNQEAMQSTSIEPVRTKTVTLTIDSVSEPAAVDGRDYTAISEVALIGG